MKNTYIYQTLEDRQDDAYVEEYGPFCCSERDLNGQLKKGVKAPWLGEGFYFWDTRIEDAQWWGETVYSGKYIICRTTYDQHSELLYDMVGDMQQFDEFVKIADYIKQQFHQSTITFPVVIAYLKKDSTFKYKAIRVWPCPHKLRNTGIEFPGDNLVLGKVDKIQLCFFDKTLLTEPYRIVQKNVPMSNQTI